jgi:diguanylate cyclase (GGDEF)-like protein
VLQARNSQGEFFVAPTYPLEFSAKWHQRDGIRAFIGLCSLLLLALLTRLLVRWRTRRLQSVVAERTSALAQANDKLAMMANLDALTELPNRRRLNEYLDSAWQNCTEQQRDFSILLIDADRFKQFNDSHGHQAGDALLKTLAKRLQHSLRRAEDMLARYGGEEFMVILPGADRTVAQALAEHMRADIAAQEIGVSISIGVASARLGSANGVLSKTLIEYADRALYQAKREGRNRVVVFDAGLAAQDRKDAVEN